MSHVITYHIFNVLCVISDISTYNAPFLGATLRKGWNIVCFGVCPLSPMNVMQERIEWRSRGGGAPAPIVSGRLQRGLGVNGALAPIGPGHLQTGGGSGEH